MSHHVSPEFLPIGSLDPWMLCAWRQARCDTFEPASVEILRRSTKSTVYRLSGSDPDRPSLVAKRCPAATASLDALIYDEILPSLPLPALRCYGMTPEPDGEFVWLFLEDAGSQAYSPADRNHRLLAARWLAVLHGTSPSARIRARLPDRGTDHYLRQLRSARDSLWALVDHPDLNAGEVELLRAVVARCDVTLHRWDELETFYDGRPRALVHGDFAVRNLRIRMNGSGPVLMVMDFEMAGWGVPAADLAQFIGRCASPDLDEYGSVLGGAISDLDPLEVARSAGFGNLLRVVDKIFWLTLSWGKGTYAELRTPLLTLKKYEPQMAATLRDLHWSGHA